MTLSFVGYDTLSEASNATEGIFNKPSGVVEGDLMYIWIASDGNQSHTAPSGWTNETSDLQEGAVSGRLFSKTAGASELSTYTVTKSSERSNGVIWAVRGHNGTDVVATAIGGTAETSFTCPTATATNANSYVFRLGGVDDGSASTPHSTATGYTMTGNVGSFSSASVSAQYKTTGSGSVGSLAISHNDTAEEWIAVTLIIAPAAASSHDLTAVAITTGSPSLGTPALGQIHGLSANGVATGAASVPTASLGQVHVLVASGITTGSPTLDTPSLAPSDSLTASGITTGSPTLDAPSLGQVHVLVAVAITTGTPALDTPALSQTDALAANGISTGPPALGTPTLGQQGPVPSVRIGYKARILIADPNRRVIGEARFAFDSIGWMINDYMDTTLHCARSDPKTTADNLRPGNWIYIELDNGLPPWAGFIWPGRKFTTGEVEVPVKSAEWYLSRFQVDKGRYFSKATAGYIVERLIAEANAAYGMGVAIGEMWGGGDLHSPDYHIESLFDIITKSVIGRLEDCEFHIEPLLVNGTIELTAHLRQRRGVRKPDVALVQGVNMIDETIVEVGPLVNHWQLAGDDISGSGQGWGNGRLMDTTTGRDEESIGRHGLWMDSEIYQTVRDQGTLSRLAQSMIRQSKSPAVSFCCGATNLAPGDYGSHQVGDSVTAVVPTATFEPIRGLYRVLGREFHPDDGTVELAIMEDADV